MRTSFLAALVPAVLWLSPATARAQPAAPTIAVREGADLALHAVALAEPLTIDGRLDERLYREVTPVSDFIQVEPVEGAPATERTELWIAFDREQLYVSFRCFESEPRRIVAKEMRRDSALIWSGDDIVAFIFDTFNDKRNGFQFTVNPLGGRQDAQIANERQWGGDWNTIWSFKVAHFDGGWTVETAIPFKSLRYRPGDGQVWGFNAMRTNRWKNELSFLKPTTKAMGQRGLLQTSMAPPLLGLETPPGSKNLEIKPYLISNATRAIDNGLAANDVDGDFGVDVKYGVTANLTADLTYNPDFAQVEADQQQVNLTRFSLFFPEKREFFLENQGTFQFGTTGGNNQVGDTPILFYSRRIGLEANRIVPIDGGGRLTGRVGRYSIGALDIQTDRERIGAVPATNFSVVRVRRDLLRRSSVGAIFTGRNELGGTDLSNQVYGVDGIFAFFANLGVNSYWARSVSSPQSDGEISYRGQLDYAGDRYGVQAERLYIDDNFRPGVGYVRRDDIEQSFGLFRFSPRPSRSKSVRKYSAAGSIKYVENTTGRLETREQWAELAVEYQNTDRLFVTNNRIYEYLPRPFAIVPGVVLPVGGYDFDNVQVGFNRGPQHRLAGNLLFERGTFYDGHKTAFSVSSGRFALTPRLSFEPNYAINAVDLIEGSFTTHLAGTRVTYTPTPMMFASAFLQYNSVSRAVSANLRLRWEYRPGSELFVVLNEERDTSGDRFSTLSNRAFIVKVNRLFRF